MPAERIVALAEPAVCHGDSLRHWSTTVWTRLRPKGFQQCAGLVRRVGERDCSSAGPGVEAERQAVAEHRVGDTSLLPDRTLHGAHRTLARPSHSRREETSWPASCWAVGPPSTMSGAWRGAAVCSTK